ncbi:FimB/Mfa2 family fimbrial subunit [Bacteroides nordii]|uniref:FimB/Mfa2 family fimbrial subunit n=1 Tax=Bacteroides nordii TaxID=291645 RepID=UPI002A7F1A02|nr:FimB/Mfa2 family fimbrial subunit [Bacteroides nordii]
MKRILTTIQKEANKILLLTVLAGAMASCDSILDFEEGDCSIEYRVKFVYDRNMAFEDAFAKEVKTVTLYAFDDEGKFVYQKTEEGEDRLGTGEYTMSVDIEPGDYHLVTWAGLDDQSFAVPLMTANSRIEDLTALTLRNKESQTRTDGEEGKYIVKDPLSPLWHGEVTKQSFTRSGRQNIVTVPLTKNTNTIRVVIAQVNQNPDKPITRANAISKERFSYTLYDDNGWMNYDNTLLKDNLLTYLPYVTEDTSISTRAFSADGTTESEYPAAVAEISVGRLLKTQKPELRIVDQQTNKNLLANGSLIGYLSLLQPSQLNMPLEEYLDREDNFGMIFFVDENMTLISTKIQINDWIVNINDFEL